MDNELYTYSPIVERQPWLLPEGRKLAFYIGLNIEHFHVDLPLGRGTIPDPMNLGRRDYGSRVGIWRLVDLFDEVGIRASAITNSEVCTRYPQIVQAGIERNWAWIAHGQTNSILEVDMEAEQEEQFLARMIATLDGALPTRPKGWLGPGLSETFATPRLLHNLGFTYLLDWCCDDQPFPLTIPGMLSVPYSLDVNDISMWMNQTFSGAEYERIVLDQFEVLLDEAEAKGSARVMALPLHTFVVGQPFRFKYLARVLREICSNPDVWVSTSDDIAAHYLATMPTAG
ncbi:MAG: polysaccharide deacetylase family protein [Acidimicrobiaceae bacterium]|nr:polysaccharide deacetylase family protein [Acidimicrobiaceae bacterium]MBO0747864.1 polysaccharide deacetylase family protein [Acidimicrobiaceae bacterium]